MVTVSAGHGVVIDTRPGNGFMEYWASTGPETVGGTFRAEAWMLESFTLEILPRDHAGHSGGTFAGIVLGTGSNGVPQATGPVDKRCPDDLACGSVRA